MLEVPFCLTRAAFVVVVVVVAAEGEGEDPLRVCTGTAGEVVPLEGMFCFTAGGLLLATKGGRKLTGVRMVEVMGTYPLGMLGVEGLLVTPKGVAGPPETGETGRALARMDRALCLALFSSSTGSSSFPLTDCRFPNTLGRAPIASYLFLSSTSLETGVLSRDGVLRGLGALESLPRLLGSSWQPSPGLAAVVLRLVGRCWWWW